MTVPVKYIYASMLLKGCVCYIFASFVCLKESTCKTRKIVFYFSSKAFFVLEIIKFQLFMYSNVMTSSNSWAWNTKHILLNNLRSNHSLVIKFGQFYVILQKKIFYQKILWKMWPGTKFQTLFNFPGIFCKKESWEVNAMIWTNFNSYISNS